MALCGACTVHVDGVTTRSCITPIDGIGNAEITTIEAIGTTPAGAKIQKAWLDCEVPQMRVEPQWNAKKGRDQPMIVVGELAM